ncbi:MAG: endolytic transglycosylase MltG [Actinobacteria bacterium]|nr:endolytic transglycosylase MltG [Actinomycetota bacterium]
MRPIGLFVQAFVIGLLSLVAALYLGFSIAVRFAASPARVAAESIVLTVPAGATTVDIGRRLQEAGLIRSDLLFRLLVERRGLDGRLPTGQYLLRKDMSLDRILAALQSERLVDRAVTFPEGWRVEEMAERLRDETAVDPDEFVRLTQTEVAAFAREFPFLRGLPPDATLNGYLFPDTYQVAAGTSARDLIRRMLTRFDEVVTPDVRTAAAARGLTLHQAITLASIIEREAALDKERPLIAGVFYNRLARGMKLETDPTVQFALGRSAASGRWWKPDLTAQDLQVASPYNTYVNAGLPPGPIAGPGLKSIEAAVAPEATPYLFFVARGDGSHAFAETAEEHARNITRFLR